MAQLGKHVTVTHLLVFVHRYCGCCLCTSRHVMVPQ
jgi:hypothetical protein